MTQKLSRFDPAEKIRSQDDARRWLKAFEDDGTPEEFAAALGDVARAYGMMRLAEEVGMPVDLLYAAVNRYPAELGALLPILEALGVSATKHSDAAE